MSPAESTEFHLIGAPTVSSIPRVRAVPDLTAKDPRLGLEVELTPRETEVLVLIARGLSNQEIADHCFLSINSVKAYVRTAYRKIKATRRSQAVAWAIRNGLGESPAPGSTQA